MGCLSFLHKWPGTLVAAFMTLNLMLPLTDCLICIEDFGPQIAIAQTQEVQTEKQSPASPQQHNDSEKSCIHGHCHHWISYPKPSERIDFEPISRHFAMVRGQYGSPPSVPNTELLRPPRA